MYESYPGDEVYWCEQRNPSNESPDGLFWLVDCIYKKRPGPATANGYSHPTDEPPQVQFGFVRYEEVVERAYNNIDGPLAANADTQGSPTKKVSNAADQQFPNPLVDDRYNMTVTVTRKELESETGPETWALLKDTINDVAITIGGIVMPQYTGRMLECKGVVKWDKDGKGYYDCTYIIEYDKNTHIRKILNQGYYYKNYANGSGELIEAKDDAGLAMRQPVLLDAFGDLLGEVDETADPPVVPIYLDFQTKWAADWTTLDLPTTPFEEV